MVVGGDNCSLSGSGTLGVLIINFLGLRLDLDLDLDINVVGVGLGVDNSSLIVFCGSGFSSSGVGGSVDLDSGTPCTSKVLDSETFIDFSSNISRCSSLSLTSDVSSTTLISSISSASSISISSASSISISSASSISPTSSILSSVSSSISTLSFVVGGDNFSLSGSVTLGVLIINFLGLDLDLDLDINTLEVGGSVDLDSGTACTSIVLDSDTFIDFSSNISRSIGTSTPLSSTPLSSSLL